MTELVPREGEVLFVPLGGCNEIGRNLTLYGHDGAWIAVDCGIGFPPAELQGGIEAILPNPEFLYRNAANIRALIVTHAHEDHLGAIPYLWGERLTCPVFAPPFAARLLQKKWQRMGEFFNALDPARAKLDLRTFQLGERFSVAPFHITAVPVAHSVPDACALCIETSCGVVLHSGDWKLDANPVLGAAAGEDLFDVAESVAKKERLPFIAMACDSTNMFEEGASGDEASTQPAFERLFRKPYRRIVVTLFASNVARTISIARAAKACGRRPTLAGSALLRMNEVARACGYLQELSFESLNARLPPEQTVLLATGSQGEIGSYMHRLAHGNAFLTRGDVAVFSSRTIPGNEIAIGKIKNALAKRGVEIVDHNTLPELHVSGHATGEEAERVYRRLRPQWFVPIHGEPRHLKENARRAERVGLKACIVHNGQGLRFKRSAKNKILGVSCENLSEVLPAEEQYLERSNDKPRWLPQSDKSIKDRRRLAEEGACACVLTLDEKNATVSEVRFLAFGDRRLEDLLEQRGRNFLAESLDALDARQDKYSRSSSHSEKRGKRNAAYSERNGRDGEKQDDALSFEQRLARAFGKQIARATGRRPLVKMLVKKQ